LLRTFVLPKFVQGWAYGLTTNFEEREQEQREQSMAKMDIDALSIEELASLRDRAIEKLAEKVAARQAELEAELDRLSVYGGRPAKKPQAAPPAPRAKKNERASEPQEIKPQGKGDVAEAA
jgi:hypothetical protein